MGGFILVNKSEHTDHEALQAAALDAFTQMGFANPHIVSTDDYVLLAFAKHQGSELAFEQFPNGDFVFSCGTLFYDGAIGKAAASAFYRDYNGSPGPRDRASGHYAVILRKGDATEIVPDSFGGYHVFCDSEMRIATSAFLAVAAALNQLTVNVQSAYEYVFTGVVSGNATLFNEIIVAPVNSTITVQAGKMEPVRHLLRLPLTTSGEDFEASIGQTMRLLDRYFASIATNFGDRVNCALSGGYDSRLILALLRRHGVRPNLYVYGPAEGQDVKLARSIAEGENLHLDIVDKTQRRVWEPEEFAAVAHRNFLGIDGYSWEGIF